MYANGAAVEPPPMTMTMEDLLNKFDWDTYIAALGNEEFTAWPILGSEEIAASPGGIEQMVTWNPVGVVAVEDTPRDLLQTTGASFPQDQSQIEQGFIQSFHDGHYPQTITPAQLHYGFEASAVHDGPFYTSHVIPNNIHPFFHPPTALEHQNISSPPVGFAGNAFHLGDNAGQFHYQSVAPNTQGIENPHSVMPSQGSDNYDPSNSPVEESSCQPQERHLSEGERNVDEDSMDEEQSQSPDERTPPMVRPPHLDGKGPAPRKKRNMNEPVDKRTCKLCDGVLSHSSSLKRHYAQHLSSPQFLTPAQIKTAEEACKGKPLSRCRHCPMLSNRLTTIVVHERVHEEGGNVSTCSVCGVVLTSPYIRKAHMRSHKNDKDNTFMRDGCHRSKTTFNTEDDHDFNYRGSDPVEDPTEPRSAALYDCRLCGANLASRSLRRHHYAAHRRLDEGDHEEEADDVKSVKGNEKEQRKAPDPEPTRFPCVECTATFRSRYLRDKHRVSHEIAELGDGKDSPDDATLQAALLRFKCEICGDAFKTKYFLQKHHAAHDEGKLDETPMKRKLDNTDHGDLGEDEPNEAQPQTGNNRAKRMRGKVASTGNASAT